MPEEKEKKEETASEPGEKPAAKGKKPLPLILMIAGLFVVAVVAFSVLQGVFSSGPSGQEKEAAEKAGEPAAADSSAVVTEDTLSDLERLEQELYGVAGADEATDMDELMNLPEQAEEAVRKEPAGPPPKDSAAAANWLEKEKARLASERAELEEMKKDLDKQEYQLKQLVAKIGQVESARINALAKLYDGMKPAQVAPLLNKLSEEQSVQVLLKMKPANAAKILGALSPDRAARISARMITLTEE